ncbi:restriction endonuclease subunit S [Methanobrevibacter wolinii]|uniref:restriction endonuclease subunit S n=1 Tax=Methanobrevibacter wolinii TaxID=190977 RepID=UPI00069399D6|nr:restriction endonuclease subunit S [Methanobrevibacter wolinii]
MSLGWEIKPFSELVEIIGGGTPKTSKNEYWDGNIPWISIKDFNNNLKHITSTEKTITKLGLDNSSTKLLKTGDIIISARGTVGEIAMLSSNMAFNQSCYGLRPLNFVDNDFIYYLLKYNLNILKNNTHGSVFDTITINTFDNIFVKIPPKNIQEKIGKLLSSFDEKISLNKKINSNLEEQILKIFNDWFVKFSLCDEFEESKLGLIPKGWSVDYLGSGKSSSIIGSGIVDFEGYKVYIATADVDNSSIINNKTLITLKNKPSRANMQPIEKSIWFAKMIDSRKLIMVDDYCENILNNYIFSTGFCGLKCSEEYFYYLWSFLLTNGFDTMKNNFCTGTTMQAVNNKDIKMINFVLPDLKTVDKFNIIAKPIFKKIYLNNLEIQKLTKLRDTLLPKLMSGEIDVSKINCDLN